MVFFILVKAYFLVVCTVQYMHGTLCFLCGVYFRNLFKIFNVVFLFGILKCVKIFLFTVGRMLLVLVWKFFVSYKMFNSFLVMMFLF